MGNWKQTDHEKDWRQHMIQTHIQLSILSFLPPPNLCEKSPLWAAASLWSAVASKPLWTNKVRDVIHWVMRQLVLHTTRRIFQPQIAGRSHLKTVDTHLNLRRKSGILTCAKLKAFIWPDEWDYVFPHKSNDNSLLVSLQKANLVGSFVFILSQKLMQIRH